MTIAPKQRRFALTVRKRDHFSSYAFASNIRQSAQAIASGQYQDRGVLLMTTTTQNPGTTERTAALPAGTLAPDFKLHSTPDQFVSLSDFRGSPLIIAFYP